MRRASVGLPTLTLFSLLAVGCSEPGTLDGDCTVRVGFEDVTHRAHNELDQKAKIGTSLGEGDLLDCDGSVVGETEVFAVVGVDPEQAIAYGKGRRLTVFVAEGLAQSDWPQPLKSASP